MLQFRNTPYSVSSEGQVYRHGKSKPLRADTNPKGYRRVTLCISGTPQRFLVHRMVAEVYLPKIPGNTEVNHINGIPGNDWVSNLEWTTKSGNQLHAINMGKKSHLNASKKASEKKFKESTEYFRAKLGSNFVSLVTESPRNFVVFNCFNCQKQLKCRTDSSVLRDDHPTCKKCKYKMKM